MTDILIGLGVSIGILVVLILIAVTRSAPGRLQPTRPCPSCGAMLGSTALLDHRCKGRSRRPKP